MPRGSTPKRERQYEHIVDSERKRGAKPKLAKEIAARTVNKERARAAGRTKDQLYAEARKRNVKGRSTMTKSELERALAR
jgi:hypothetical protein